MKRHANFLIERDVVQAAKVLAKTRNRSLSRLVQECLEELIANSPDLPPPGEHWLDAFHRRYLPDGRMPRAGINKKRPA